MKKRYLGIAGLIILFASIAWAATTVTMGIRGAEDINWASGGSGAAETFTQNRQIGDIVKTFTLTKPDATHLKMRSVSGSVETAITTLQSTVLALTNGAYSTTLKIKEIILKGPEVDARAYGTVGTQAAIIAALADIGSKQKTLVLYPAITDTTTTWAITADQTIPANVTLKVGRGAIVSNSTATTKILTINGALEAGPYQIFSLSGTGQVVLTGEVKPEWWYSDSGDYNAAITAAMKSNRKVVFQAGKNYPYLGLISIPASTNLTVSAYGATLTNGDVTSQSIQFTSAVNFNWLGGSHRYIGATTNQTGAEHVLYFIDGSKISVQDFDILGSPEMGIVYNNCVNVTTKNCIISGTHRDGIHHIYCANALVEGNKLSQISDDAIAFHDYGLDAGKAVLIAAGYPQAYGATIRGNIIEFAYQGIASIGGASVDISHNTIKETVNAGIAVYGSAALAVGGTVVPLDFNIGPNILRHNGGTQTINGVSLANSGQSSTGRAAIVVCSLDAGSAIGGTKYPHDGAIHHNQIIESYISGIYKDGLQVNVDNNYIYNGNIDQQVDTGTMLASFGTGGLLSTNVIIDDRTPKKHTVGYYSAAVGGFEIGNIVSGFTNEARYSTSTTPINLGAGNPIPTTPAVPATTVEARNTNYYPVKVAIAGGTVTVIAKGPTSGGLITTGATAGIFILEPNEYIAITYTVAPTWAWSGL